MSRYYCDLHIHSCLSPCADDDMTPGNIAGMAAINGLQIVALTDHNSCANCPSFFKQAKAMGLIPIPGMELTTAEDIHVICLFPDLASAMNFDEFVSGYRPFIQNKPEIFGHQYVIDKNDEIVRETENLLLHASTLSLEDAYREVGFRGGVCYPAHIDRSSNGLIGVLGDFPPSPAYTAFELNDADSLPSYLQRFPQLSSLLYTISSDAHTLGAISEATFSIEIEDEPYSSALVRERLIAKLARSNHG